MRARSVAAAEESGAELASELAVSFFDQSPIAHVHVSPTGSRDTAVSLAHAPDLVVSPVVERCEDALVGTLIQRQHSPVI